MNTIGEKIKDLRESKGLNTKELTEILDIDELSYIKLENDKKSISVSVSELKKLVEFFNVSANYIIGIGKPKEDRTMYMKNEKGMSDEEIDEVNMILSMMDEAMTLYNMRRL